MSPIPNTEFAMRILEPLDLAWIDLMLQSPSNLGNLPPGFIRMAPEKRITAIWDLVYSQYVIMSLPDERAAGVISLIEVNWNAMSGTLRLLLDPTTPISTGINDILISFIRRITLTFNWNKLTIKYLKGSLNLHVFSSAFKTAELLQLEGTLWNHAFVGGSTQDLMILSMFRQSWDTFQTERNGPDHPSVRSRRFTGK